MLNCIRACAARVGARVSLLASIRPYSEYKGYTLLCVVCGASVFNFVITLIGCLRPRVTGNGNDSALDVPVGRARRGEGVLV